MALDARREDSAALLAATASIGREEEGQPGVRVRTRGGLPSLTTRPLAGQSKSGVANVAFANAKPTATTTTTSTTTTTATTSNSTLALSAGRRRRARARGPRDGAPVWQPWPLYQVSAALANGSLSKRRLLLHMVSCPKNKRPKPSWWLKESDVLKR